MGIAVLRIDLGKTTCSVAGRDGDGAVVLRKRIRHHRLLAFLSRLSPCVVAMEACDGAHHLGHFCVEQGISYTANQHCLPTQVHILAVWKFTKH